MVGRCAGRGGARAHAYLCGAAVLITVAAACTRSARERPGSSGTSGTSGTSRPPAGAAFAGALASTREGTAPDGPPSAAASTTSGGEASPAVRASGDAGIAARLDGATTTACAPIGSPKPDDRDGSLQGGPFRYAVDRNGDVLARRKAGAEWGPARRVGRARPGTRIAAASFGDSHGVVAFLAERPSSEGAVLQAFVSLDDGEPVRLSDEGSGATSVALAPTTKGVIAASLDARMAMSPVHVRELSLGAAGLVLSDDAVVYVGGAAERFARVAVTTSTSGQAFVLFPTPVSALDFGLAAIRVGSPPTADAPSTLLPYAYGLDPAPIAGAGLGSRPCFVRVVPESAGLHAPERIEMGCVGRDGLAVIVGVIARGAIYRDVELTELRDGSAKGAAAIHYAVRYVDAGGVSRVQPVRCVAEQLPQ